MLPALEDLFARLLTAEGRMFIREDAWAEGGTVVDRAKVEVEEMEKELRQAWSDAEGWEKMALGLIGSMQRYMERMPQSAFRDELLHELKLAQLPTDELRAALNMEQKP